jgi:hypothetical protein
MAPDQSVAASTGPPPAVQPTATLTTDTAEHRSDESSSNSTNHNHNINININNNNNNNTQATAEGDRGASAGSGARAGGVGEARRRLAAVLPGWRLERTGGADDAFAALGKAGLGGTTTAVRGLVAAALAGRGGDSDVEYARRVTEGAVPDARALAALAGGIGRTVVLCRRIGGDGEDVRLAASAFRGGGAGAGAPPLYVAVEGGFFFSAGGGDASAAVLASATDAAGGVAGDLPAVPRERRVPPAAHTDATAETLLPQFWAGREVRPFDVSNPAALAPGVYPVAPRDEGVAAWRWLSSRPDAVTLVAANPLPGLAGDWRTVPVRVTEGHRCGTRMQRRWVSGPGGQGEAGAGPRAPVPPPVTCTLHALYVPAAGAGVPSAAVARAALERFAAPHDPSAQASGGRTMAGEAPLAGVRLTLAVRKEQRAAVLRASGAPDGNSGWVLVREPAEERDDAAATVVWLTATAAPSIAEAAAWATRLGAAGGVALDAKLGRLGVRVASDGEAAARLQLGDAARRAPGPAWRVDGVPAAWRRADVLHLLRTEGRWAADEARLLRTWEGSGRAAWRVEGREPPPATYFVASAGLRVTLRPVPARTAQPQPPPRSQSARGGQQSRSREAEAATVRSGSAPAAAFATGAWAGRGVQGRGGRRGSVRGGGRPTAAAAPAAGQPPPVATATAAAGASDADPLEARFLALRADHDALARRQQEDMARLLDIVASQKEGLASLQEQMAQMMQMIARLQPPQPQGTPAPDSRAAPASSRRTGTKAKRGDLSPPELTQKRLVFSPLQADGQTGSGGGTKKKQRADGSGS